MDRPTGDKRKEKSVPGEIKRKLATQGPLQDLALAPELPEEALSTCLKSPGWGQGERKRERGQVRDAPDACTALPSGSVAPR